MADAARGIPRSLISDVVWFDYDTPVTKIVPALKKSPAIVIRKGGEYYGIVDSRVLYRAERSLNFGKNEKIEKYAVNVPRITSSTAIDDLVYYFYKNRIKALPYSDDGRSISGVFERKTLLKVLLSLKMLKDINVNDAMSSPVLAIDHGASVSQAKNAMRQSKVNGLVVLQDGRFAGIITNHDIVHRYTRLRNERLPEMKTKAFSPSNLVVESVMEKNPRTIDYGKNVADAVRQFVEQGISSLVVTRKGMPVGMLSVNDVFESIIARRRIEERKIFMSGFDQYTYGYEDEVREYLRVLIGEVERLKGVKVDYITLRIKKVKVKAYELQARLALAGGRGIISIDTTKYTFWEAVRDLVDKLRRRVTKEKERTLTVRKVNAAEEGEI